LWQFLFVNKNNVQIASTSISCGLMDDLLRLDYSSCKNYHLTGIDLDKRSLDLAVQSAKVLIMSLSIEKMHGV
jgi:hypothetical protein